MRTIALGLAFILVGAFPAPAAADASDRVDVLIRFHAPPTSSDLQVVATHGAEISRTFRIVPAIAASVPEQALAALRANPRIAAVEPDSLLYALEYRSTHDWGIGHINADDVHNQETSNLGAGVRVAVLDSGIDCDHLELPQTRCDDGQLHGYNFVDNTSEADDDYGHGTHVAGTIAATLNTAATGVVGVAPEAKLVALKTLDSSGSGAWSRHIAAIEHVWNEGNTPLVDVVNMSIGRGDYNSTAEIAMQNAYDSGILLVAAAGNSGKCSGRGTNLAYPALFASVIAVAAIDSSNARPCWSSTGDKVELAAPGVSVFSTWPSDMSTSYLNPQPVCEGGVCHYKYGSGTSMSSPHVAGTAALVIASGFVDELSGTARTDALRQRLAATAVDLGTSGRDPQFGYGLVDAAAAVGLSSGGGDANASPTASFTYACTDLSCSFDGSGSSDSDGSVASYAWDFGDRANAGGATASHTYAADGTYTVTLTVTDDDGANDGESKSVTVSADSGGGISLTASGRKVAGKHTVDLSWTDSTGLNVSQVDVFRNGTLAATTDNDGAYTDFMDTRGGGSYTYKVCHPSSEGGTCSNEATVEF